MTGAPDRGREDLVLCARIARDHDVPREDCLALLDLEARGLGVTVPEADLRVIRDRVYEDGDVGDAHAAGAEPTTTSMEAEAASIPTPAGADPLPVPVPTPGPVIPEKMIRQTLTLLFSPGQVVELRTWDKRGRIRSGYFNDMEALAKAAEALDIPETEGVYVTPNRIKPDLLYRRSNRIDFVKTGESTSDQDVDRLEWLLIDADPNRPVSKISSTNEEHRKAIEKAHSIRGILLSLGFPPPIVADSGNGGHVNVKIDLPNTEENRALIAGCLQALQDIAGDSEITIDQTTKNPARVWKLYGSVARKGDNLPERPHRRARLLEVPVKIEPAARELLEQLAAMRNPPAMPAGPARIARAAREIDLADWLREHGARLPGYKEVQKTGWRYFFEFETCPFNSSHTTGAFCGQLLNGALVAKCHHNSCGALTQRWDDLRRTGEPDRKISPQVKASPPPVAAQPVGDTPLFESLRNGGVKPLYENIAATILEEMRIVSWGGSIFLYHKEKGIFVMNHGEVEARIQDILNVGKYDGSITHATVELIHRLTYADPAMEYPFNHERDLIPVANGVLKIDHVVGSAILLSHSPEYRFTYRLPVLYDGAAPTNPVKAVLLQWVNDETLPVLLQVSAQAILQSAGLVYKKAYIFEGDHDAGKSSYLLLLSQFFGGENVAGVDLRAICEDRFALSNLERKLINVYDDLGSFPIRYVGKFKAVTGKIDHRMERKGKDAYDGVITATHIFTCNEPPRIKEIADDAFWRRWEYLDFPNSFALDPTWTARTFTPTFLSGYLNLVVQAMIKIIKKGGLLVDSPPEVVKDKWVRAAEPLADFMADETIQDQGFYICQDVFYQRFVAWCKKKERGVETKTRVTRLLGTMGHHSTQKRPHGKQEWVYTGMRWMDESRARCGVPPDRPETPLTSNSP